MTLPREELQGDDPAISFKYVAFCDVLGFSAAVLDRFDETIAIYRDFMVRMRDWPMPEKAEVSIYSDSILIVADELAPVVHAVQSLWFVILSQNLMIRGGIAYGRYWEQRENGHLFVVSDALVRAVELESKVGYPAVAFSPEVELGLGTWVSRHQHGALHAPILHFNGLTLVNPFNLAWFQSAMHRAKMLLDRFPMHAKKYEWFLGLAAAVESNAALVPQAALEELLRLGALAPMAEDGDVAA